MAAVFTVALIQAFGSDDAAKKEEPAATETAAAKEEPAKKEETKKAEPKKEVNKPTITKAEFDKIKNGMSIKEVEKIIGGEGELSSEVGAEGDTNYTVLYMYKGEAFASNANVTFQGSPAVVAMKAQAGLK